MISPSFLIDCLADAGVESYVGVPDSLLKSLVADLDSHPRVRNHVISANEGAAVGFAVGIYLESEKPAAVYLQNSGLGNAINPLTSLAHREVYGTPMFLIIGWRGEPGKSDEPQHMVQGRITGELLRVIGIPFIVLNSIEDRAREQLYDLSQSMKASPGPVAIVVPDGTLASSTHNESSNSNLAMTREEALKSVIGEIPIGDRVVVTTGMLARELWEIRREKCQVNQFDFLVVGGMGHASAIAHGVASAGPDLRVWCLDGDGSLLMHLGSLAVIAKDWPRNLKHVLFNNHSHDSVGGQTTAATSVHFEALCNSLGYGWVGSTEDPEHIPRLVQDLIGFVGPAMAEMRVKKGARSNLGRPPTSLFKPGTHFPTRKQLFF